MKERIKYISEENFPDQEKTYFKGLNTLRFLAAFLVMLQHSESMKLKNGLSYLGKISLFHNGHYAVTFFFILSGFLITFFLLKQKKTTSTIHVRRFYIKRILRIFPLYFLLVFFGTLVVPFFVTYFGVDYDIPYTFGQSWYYYVLFLPCLVTFHYGHHLLEPLWSIGVEVFFYTIWAPLLKVIKKNVLPLLISIIILKVVLLSISYFTTVPKIYSFLVGIFSFESMAVGGLGAYFLFHTEKDISSLFLFKKKFQYIIIILLVVFILFNRNIDNPIWALVFSTPILSSLLINFIFLYIIIAISLHSNGLINEENKTLWYFGEISYGIYMYHTTVISVVILGLKKSPISLNSVSLNLIFYILVIGGTVLISHLSKKYFENIFLKLGKRE